MPATDQDTENYEIRAGDDSPTTDAHILTTVISILLRECLATAKLSLSILCHPSCDIPTRLCCKTRAAK